MSPATKLGPAAVSNPWADTLETFRRMAYGLCECCGKDYTAHDPSPQSKCEDERCQRNEESDHCHESDFKCASDDPTLLSRDQLRQIYEAISPTAHNENYRPHEATIRPVAERAEEKL